MRQAVRYAIAGVVLVAALVVAIFLIQPSYVQEDHRSVHLPTMDHHVAERFGVAVAGLVLAAAIAFPSKDRTMTLRIRYVVAGAVLGVSLLTALFLIRPSGIEGMWCTIAALDLCLDHHVTERVMVAIAGLVGAAAIVFVPFGRRSTRKPTSN